MRLFRLSHCNGMSYGNYFYNYDNISKQLIFKLIVYSLIQNCNNTVYSSVPCGEYLHRRRRSQWEMYRL